MIDENISIMLDYANQVIILCPPVEDLWKNVEELKKQLKKYVRPEETVVFTVLSRSKPEFAEVPFHESSIDFEIPYMSDFPSLTIEDDDYDELRIPNDLVQMMTTFIDRLERTNQIGIFIPTTIDVDKAIDTSTYVERTLNFLAERFGGATSKEVSGVWNSDKAGLVGEKVFFVYTYVTLGAMTKYMDEVIEYVKELKVELKQEAMALEVNRKLTLI
jgi:hypothetical protein